MAATHRCARDQESPDEANRNYPEGHGAQVARCRLEGREGRKRSRLPRVARRVAQDPRGRCVVVARRPAPATLWEARALRSHRYYVRVDRVSAPGAWRHPATDAKAPEERSALRSARQ